MTTVYGIDPERLHVTIYLTTTTPTATGAKSACRDDHIHRRDEDLNYWFSFPNGTPGASGPCGPDSEIYYDLYPERGLEGAQLPLDRDGEPMGGVGYDDERFLEIWNLVFMQLYQHPDGHREPLPAQNIDTGSGLERVAMVIQGMRSVFETDIFLPILEAAAGVVRGRLRTSRRHRELQYAIRAMSEHCRAATLLIGDGVVPSNEGRGYVLRRVIRRAVYLARKVGVTRAVHGAPRRRGDRQDEAGYYTHLDESRDFIERALDAEEERFVRTLASGPHAARIAARTAPANRAPRSSPATKPSTLYDTFGLPLELTREIAAGEGFGLDDAGFEAAMEAQRTRARASTGKFLKGEALAALAGARRRTLATSSATATSKADGARRRDPQGRRAGDDRDRRAKPAKSILDDHAVLPRRRRPGWRPREHSHALRRLRGGRHAGSRRGDRPPRPRDRGGDPRGRNRRRQPSTSPGALGRRGTTPARTCCTPPCAQVLGTHVRQQGSLVTPDRLRFDFTHLEQTPRAALAEVQQLANEKVRARPRGRPGATTGLPAGGRRRRARVLRRQVRRRCPRRRDQGRRTRRSARSCAAARTSTTPARSASSTSCASPPWPRARAALRRSPAGPPRPT